MSLLLLIPSTTETDVQGGCTQISICVTSVVSLRKGHSHWGFDIKKEERKGFHSKAEHTDVQGSFYLHYYVSILSEGWGVIVMACAGPSGDSLWESMLSLYLWVSGIKL